MARKGEERIFIDAAFLYALLDVEHGNHTEAAATYRQWKRRRVVYYTTSTVLAETGNYLGRSALRHKLPALYELLEYRLMNVVWVNRYWLDRGREKFEEGTYKRFTWGLADCVSMAVMDHLGIRTVLTTDRHFQQAGYTVA